MKKIRLKKMITIVSFLAIAVLNQPVYAEEVFTDSSEEAETKMESAVSNFTDESALDEVFSAPTVTEPVSPGSVTDKDTLVYEGILYKIEGENSEFLTAIGYTEELKETEEIIIPAFIDEKEVYALGEGCFSGLNMVKRIEIPGTVTSIPTNALDSWGEITLICSMNSNAYYFAANNNISYDTTKLPASYVKDSDENGIAYVFDWKTQTYTAAGIEYISEPVDVIYKEVIDGYPVTEIDTNKFFGIYFDDQTLAHMPVKSIYVPNGIQTIAGGEYIPDNYTITDDKTGYRNMTTVIFEDGDTPLVLGQRLFESCDSLTEVKLSSRVRELPAYMFVDCKALTQLELPEGMTKIGQAALQGVPNLEYLYIPSSVTDIAVDAMDGLTKLTVHGEANSYAEYYCRTHGIPFEAEGSVEQEKPYIVSAEGELRNHWLYFTVDLLREMDGAEGYEYQTLASDGETVLRTKKASAASCVLAKAPNDIYVRVRSWKTENGEKVYSEWSDKAHLYLDVTPGTMVLNKAAGNGRKVTLTFADNANFFKESDGFDCRLEKTSASGRTYIKKNQKRRTITFTNVKPGTYTAKARAYKLVNGEKVYGGRSNTIRVVVK